MMQYDNYMLYCHNQAARMYPQIYNDIYPYVKNACEREDYPNNPRMEPFPNEEKVDEMVESIYDEYRKGKKDKNHKEENLEYDDMYRIRRDDARDLIRILLLRELLGRRRRFPRRRRRPFFPGYYDYDYRPSPFFPGGFF